MNKLEKIRKLVEKSQGELVACGCDILMKIRRILGERKLFAIVHDGTLDGDNAFYCPDDKVPFKEGQTIRDIRDAYRDKRVAEDAPEPSKLSPAELRLVTDEANDRVDLIAGAWIVNEETIEQLNAVWNAADPCNDSGSYATNRTTKGIARRAAIRHPGKKVK